MNDNVQAGDNPVDRPGDLLGRDESGFPPIPEELEYLVEPAIQYGRKYQFDDAVQWFLENAKESDFEILATLAERARLSGDYLRLMRWMDDVGDVLDRTVDERYPYSIDISEQQRKDFLRLINPSVGERSIEKGVRQLAEANDSSDLAKRRREVSGQLLSEANNKVHHMDIYFLFGLMDACDMKFESE